MEHLLNLHDLEQSYKAYKNELTERDFDGIKCLLNPYLKDTPDN